MVHSAWGRLRIIVCAGLCSAASIAESRSGLYGITFENSIPQVAEIITFGLESSILIANSLKANPPNTTEWIAPNRAQANIAITASGTIGM
jgi:hypothetical protein